MKKSNPSYDSYDGAALDYAGQGRLRYAPAEHPPVTQSKIGVLLANLGTPDHYGYWPLRRYLNEFLSDRRVIDYSPWLWQPLLQLVILTKRPFSSGAAYKSIWNHDTNESPLMTITKNQTQAIRKALHKQFPYHAIEVDFCMRYGNPSTPKVVHKMVRSGCERILFFSLYPQYAGATTATANDQFFRALAQETWQPSVRTISSYCDHPAYIQALAHSVQQAYQTLVVKPQVLVASYHGMPKRYLLKGDPYHCHCQKTSRLLRQALGFSNDALITTFQSRFGPEQWLSPYTVDKVAELAKNGIKHIAVIAPAFSADCLETLEEIREEIKDSFLDSGGESFFYIPCLNDAKEHIHVLTDIISENLKGWV